MVLVEEGIEGKVMSGVLDLYRLEGVRDGYRRIKVVRSNDYFNYTLV